MASVWIWGVRFLDFLAEPGVGLPGEEREGERAGEPPPHDLCFLSLSFSLALALSLSSSPFLFLLFQLQTHIWGQALRMEGNTPVLVPLLMIIYI